jgi:hypothetical protein
MYDLLALDVLEKESDSALRFRIADRASLLPAAEVDSLIQRLVLLRARMQPPQPAQPEASGDYPLEMDPCWRVDYSPLLGPVLLLRHSGAGWTAYALPAESIDRLVRALAVKPPASSAEKPLWN